jgi:ABC-type proline/glycine betaine transport system permease subunit
MTKKKNDDQQILVNKLSVVDAQHLHKIEGGFLSGWEILFQLVSIAFVHVFVARAIYLAQATIWHLVLPLVAEYYVYLLAIPLSQLVVRHGELATVSRQCLRVLAIQVAIMIAVGVAWPLASGKNVVDQWRLGWDLAWNWIVGTQMHWPILIAGVYSALNVKRNVDKLVEYGPPFAGPGVGCAMRILVFFFAIVLVPALAMFLGPLVLYFFPGLKSFLNEGAVVWFIWLIFLIADLGRLGMRWDIQRRLQRAGKLPSSNQVS